LVVGPGRYCVTDVSGTSILNGAGRRFHLSISSATRAICLDASALVKVYIEEDGSALLRDFLATEPTRYTTPLCLYEALSVFKVKYVYRKEITRDQYDDATLSLVAWFQGMSDWMKDLDFMKVSVFRDVQEIARKHNLDLSDAFQILSVKEGYFSRMSGESRTILVTADEALARAANDEGIKAWYCMGGSSRP
jgi:predicted nucleic acid-binding protein